MGLSPLSIIDIFEALKTLKQERGLTIMLCEQNARLAVRYADRVLVLSDGTSMPSRGGKAISFDAAYFGDIVELGHAAASNTWPQHADARGDRFEESAGDRASRIVAAPRGVLVVGSVVRTGLNGTASTRSTWS